MTSKTSSLFVLAAILALSPGDCPADAYRVFDWEGKTVPTKPTEAPPGPGSVTETVYLNGGQYRDGAALSPLDVRVDITVEIWNDPARWRIDTGLGPGTATYGYQSPDEAEFNFGETTGQMIMRMDFIFSQPVDNPSFFLMDIDNTGVDHGTQFKATTQGGGTIYPTLSLASNSTVAWTGDGATLDVFSNGASSSDSEARGAAFFEWNAQNVTSISFVWESAEGTTIRMSNIYGEFDPAGFTVVAAPEPSSALLGLVFAGGLMMRRRRPAAA